MAEKLGKHGWLLFSPAPKTLSHAQTRDALAQLRQKQKLVERNILLFNRQAYKVPVVCGTKDNGTFGTPFKPHFWGPPRSCDALRNRGRREDITKPLYQKLHFSRPATEAFGLVMRFFEKSVKMTKGQISHCFRAHFPEVIQLAFILSQTPSLAPFSSRSSVIKAAKRYIHRFNNGHVPSQVIRKFRYNIRRYVRRRIDHRHKLSLSKLSHFARKKFMVVANPFLIPFLPQNFPKRKFLNSLWLILSSDLNPAVTETFDHEDYVWKPNFESLCEILKLLSTAGTRTDKIDIPDLITLQPRILLWKPSILRCCLLELQTQPLILRHFSSLIAELGTDGRNPYPEPSAAVKNKNFLTEITPLSIQSMAVPKKRICLTAALNADDRWTNIPEKDMLEPIVSSLEHDKITYNRLVYVSRRFSHIFTGCFTREMADVMLSLSASADFRSTVLMRLEFLARLPSRPPANDHETVRRLLEEETDKGFLRKCWPNALAYSTQINGVTPQSVLDVGRRLTPLYSCPPTFIERKWEDLLDYNREIAIPSDFESFCRKFYELSVELNNSDFSNQVDDFDFAPATSLDLQEDVAEEQLQYLTRLIHPKRLQELLKELKHWNGGLELAHFLRVHLAARCGYRIRDILHELPDIVKRDRDRMLRVVNYIRKKRPATDPVMLIRLKQLLNLCKKEDFEDAIDKLLSRRKRILPQSFEDATFDELSYREQDSPQICEPAESDEFIP